MGVVPKTSIIKILEISTFYGTENELKMNLKY